MGLKKLWKKFKKPLLGLGGAALGSMLLPGIGSALGASISGATGGAIGSAAGAALDQATDSGSWAGGGTATEVADAPPPSIPAFVFQPGTGQPGPGAPPHSGSSANQVVEVLGKGLSQGLGQLPSAAIGAAGQWWQNHQQIDQAQKQMDFQAEQTGTGYQRAVKDMQAAGLNPMLAYSQGPAPSAGGAQAQIGNMASSALSAAQGTQALRNARATEEETWARADNIKADTELMENRQALLGAQFESTRMGTQQSWHQIRKLSAEVENLMIEGERQSGTAAQYIAQEKIRTKLLEAQEIMARANTEEAKAMAEFWKSSFGQGTPWARAIGTIFKGVTAIGRSLH